MSMQMFRRIVGVLVLMVAAFVITQGVLAQQVIEVQLIGTIEALTTDSITVNGRYVDTRQAQVQTALEVGVLVHVEGTLGSDNIITAREIRAADAAGLLAGEVEVIGILTSQAGSTMVVGGQTFDVSAAEIATGVTVGQLVKIHATQNAQGTWVAREVSPFTVMNPNVPSVSEDEFEIVGTLEQIGMNSIVVSGQTISIVGAEINDPLLVGVLVKVHLASSAGELVAREVELAQRDTMATVVIIGTVSSINANVIVVNNYSITLSAGDPFLATLQVGSAVYVEGTFQADGSIMAIHARLMQAGDDNANSNDNSDDNSNDNANANSNDNTVGTPAITMQRATEIALNVYPNATVLSIELTTKFGGTLVWEVHLSNRIEMNIDANDGTILTIDRPGDDDNNDNANNNDNSNDNGDDHGNDNDSNDNNDDDHNDNGDDDNGNDNDD